MFERRCCGHGMRGRGDEHVSSSDLDVLIESWQVEAIKKFGEMAVGDVTYERWQVEAIKMFAQGKPPPEMKKGIERIMANPQLQEAMGQGMGIGHVCYCQLPL